MKITYYLILIVSVVVSAFISGFSYDTFDSPIFDSPIHAQDCLSVSGIPDEVYVNEEIIATYHIAKSDNNDVAYLQRHTGWDNSAGPCPVEPCNMPITVGTDFTDIFYGTVPAKVTISIAAYINGSICGQKEFNLQILENTYLPIVVK